MSLISPALRDIISLIIMVALVTLSYVIITDPTRAKHRAENASKRADDRVAALAKRSDERIQTINATSGERVKAALAHADTIAAQAHDDATKIITLLSEIKAILAHRPPS